MITDLTDRTIVQYRTVVNDAMVHAWEPMPEVQPPTLTGLIAYLRLCKWDPEALTLERLRDGAMIANVGMRKQFFLPTEPTEAEVQIIDAWAAPAENECCPICGCKLNLTELYLNTERSHAFECQPCDVVFSRASRVAHSSQIMKSTLDSAVQRAANRPQASEPIRESQPAATTVDQQVALAERLIALAERCGAHTNNPSNWPIQFSPPSLLGFVHALINSPELREVAMLHAAQSFLEDKGQPINPINSDPVGWGRSMLDWGDKGVKPEAMSGFLLAIGEATLRVNALLNEKNHLIKRLETRNQAMDMSGKLNRRLLGVIEEMGDAQLQAADAGPDHAEKVMLRARIKELERLMSEPVLAGMHAEARAQTLDLPPAAAGMLCGMFIQMLDAVDARITSTNYLETGCKTPHQGELVVTVQRLQGKSPHTLRKQAESDKAILVKMLEAHGISIPEFPEVEPQPYPARANEEQAALPNP